MKGTSWRTVDELMSSVDWGSVDPDTLVYKVVCAGSIGSQLQIAGGWPTEEQAIAHARTLVLSRRTLNARAEVLLEGQTRYVVDRHEGLDGRPWRVTPRQRLSPLATPSEPIAAAGTEAEPEGPAL